jgi:hypothetical protein
LGRPINPYLFRDCAATSVAIDDPRHIGIAWRLLGHRTPKTTEQYYNQARSVEAELAVAKFSTLSARTIGTLKPVEMSFWAPVGWAHGKRVSLGSSRAGGHFSVDEGDFDV